MNKYTLPKTLTLDYTEWIFGQPGNPDTCHSEHNTHGEGATKLLNKEGYMCCLGQFSEQAGVNRTKLLEEEYPSYVGIIQDLVRTRSKPNNYSAYCNSTLTCQAVKINDDRSLDLQTRVNKLRDVFAEYGYTIQLQNFPKGIK